MKTLIAPSLLSADFSCLASEISQVEAAGVSLLHLDVMDGRFVPNITFGPPLVKAVRGCTRLTLDAHLMVADPDRYLEAFVQAGADMISVHQEACTHLDRTLRRIRELGVQAGAVLNPATPVATLEHVLELCDFVLLMSVNPGFGGQRFIPQATVKVGQLAAALGRQGLKIPIEVDGGVDATNAGQLVAAGASILVAGNSVFGRPDRGAAIAALLAAAGGQS
jgi:ribulose-phosphate 3-epimerase